MKTLLALLSSIPLFAQTGTPQPSLASFDQMVTGLITKYSIPGATLAIVRGGQLMYARGYGYADQQNQIAMQPDSRLRIASLSKAITAVTVLHLVEQGRLILDQPAFALLPDLQAPPGTTEDPRLSKITIRNLLNHTGGWNDMNDAGFDPMFQSPAICKALGVPAPASTENLIRYMRGRPLDFDPGTEYAYSNFGYAVLGRIIERVTNMSYEQYARLNVLAPMGISNMRVGNTFPQGRLPSEVVYKSPSNGQSVFANVPGPVPAPYGTWYHEGLDSLGGWVATAIDYAKFLSAIDGRRGQAFLSASSIAQMTAKPATVASYTNATSWYGFGIQVNSNGLWSHSGSLPGTVTCWLKYPNGLTLVLFFNYRDESNESQMIDDAENGLASTQSKIATWPLADQFLNYPDTPLQITLNQPALVTREGVENAATFNRGVVSGSWISLFGENLSGNMRTWTGADIVNGSLPTSLDGVSVKINGEPAFVEFISPKIVNVQAPAGLQPGWMTTELTYNGLSSGVVLTNTVLNAPGAFGYVASGTLFTVATTAQGVLIGDPSLVPGSTFAEPGSTIVIYASGLDPSAPGIASPEVTNITSSVKISIGGESVSLEFAGLITPGLFQINANVPKVPNGDQPLVITVAGAVSPATTIPIHQ